MTQRLFLLDDIPQEYLHIQRSRKRKMLPSAPPFPSALLSSSSTSTFERRSARKDEHRDEYGRPPKGSRTEQRGLAAQAHIHQEVKYLCEMIQSLGENVSQSSTPMFQITFRKLFDIYTNISNKLVGILLRARKHGFIHFDEQYEALFQNQHDEVKITLLRMPDD